MTASLAVRPLNSSRLRPAPAPEVTTVRRPRLLQALRAGGGPLVAVVAPAGYGKTTLLREWCTLDRRRSPWLPPGRRHDDPLVLLRAIARAVDEAAAVARDGRLLLVIDDVHVLRS